MLPSRKKITNTLLAAKYATVSERVKCELADVEFVSITTDMWTSNSTESFVAVTAHFVTQQWQLKTLLLNCVRFEGSHTSENIKSGVLDVCTEWGIQQKVQAIVTDNARNMIRAVELLEFKHWPCFAHTLNLVVQDAVDTCKTLRIKVKKIARFFNKSTSAADVFRNVQLGKAIDGAAPAANNDVVDLDVDRDAVIADEQHDNSDDDVYEEQVNANGPEEEIAETVPVRKVAYKLINDVDTRWNSTLSMFVRVCLVEQPLVATIALLQNKKVKVASIDADEFTSMNEMSKILKPFLDVTTELSA